MAYLPRLLGCSRFVFSNCLAVLLLLVLYSQLVGQHTHPHGPGTAKPALEVKPKTDEFKAATEEMREHVKKLRELLVRYNVSTSVELDRKYRNQWNQLIGEGFAIQQSLVAAALAEYKAHPAENPALADMLWGIVERGAEADRFEGLLPVAQALFENDYPEEKLHGTLALTAFALNGYDEAKPLLDQLVQQGVDDPQLWDLRQELARVKQLWEEELKIREQDAQGEPLPRVLMRTTKGNIEIELFENQAPETVGNFISLVEAGFYEGLVFHRVLQHFMAQTGCPLGDGTGDAGYKIRGEMKKPNARNFFRGTLGMALAEHPDSGGSQFFISFNPTYHLNGDYTAFGRIVSGIEVLGSLARIDPDGEKDKSQSAEMPDEIVSIEVLHKRDHEYKPNKVQ